MERCRELGAASAQYISGTMEDMAFAEHVVKEAQTSLGTFSDSGTLHLALDMCLSAMCLLKEAGVMEMG